LFVVAHYFQDWILQIFEKDNRLYALLSLALIIAQGLLLDLLTRTVMNSVHPKWK
jgi:hypothetical protein